MRALVLSSSPRRNGNSATLARAAATGLHEAGHQATFVTVDDVMNSFLRDCRTCRKTGGECGIEDQYRSAFMNQFLPAEGFIAATPIYWYGMSAQLKAFFDRMFCYVAASHPQSASVVAKMQGKRVGLVLSSEEIFPTVSTGIVHQIQEYCRYTRSTFVGVVHGYGNSRADVASDPNQPITRAKRFGAEFFTAHATDYQIDVLRPARVWG
jgi:multimeric flavodoxin WrbA